jgi:predicted ATP-grasp superfamily ATP-dependent carboligase
MNKIEDRLVDLAGHIAKSSIELTIKVNMLEYNLADIEKRLDKLGKKMEKQRREYEKQNNEN